MSWMTTEDILLIQLERKPRSSRRFVEPSILMLRSFPWCWGKSNGWLGSVPNGPVQWLRVGLVFAEFAVDLKFFGGEFRSTSPGRRGGRLRR